MPDNRDNRGELDEHNVGEPLGSAALEREWRARARVFVPRVVAPRSAEAFRFTEISLCCRAHPSSER